MRMKKMNQNRFSLVCFSVTRPTYLHQECPCRRRLAVPTEAPPAESSTTASSKVGSPFAPQGRDLPSLSLSLSLSLSPLSLSLSFSSYRLARSRFTLPSSNLRLRLHLHMRSFSSSSSSSSSSSHSVWFSVFFSLCLSQNCRKKSAKGKAPEASSLYPAQGEGEVNSESKVNPLLVPRSSFLFLHLASKFRSFTSHFHFR